MNSLQDVCLVLPTVFVGLFFFFSDGFFCLFVGVFLNTDVAHLTLKDSKTMIFLKSVPSHNLAKGHSGKIF